MRLQISSAKSRRNAIERAGSGTQKPRTMHLSSGLKLLFHAITSANGRFKTGQFIDIGAEGVDVYNTMLDAMGATRQLGPADRERTAVDAIRG
jgi:hypothetical protein